MNKNAKNQFQTTTVPPSEDLVRWIMQDAFKLSRDLVEREAQRIGSSTVSDTLRKERGDDDAAIADLAELMIRNSITIVS